MGRQPKPSALSPGAESEVMTLQEVAEYLHCHYTTAFRLVRQGVVPSFKLGSSWRCLKSEIDQWIAKGGGSTPAKSDGRRRRKRNPASRLTADLITRDSEALVTRPDKAKRRG